MLTGSINWTPKLPSLLLHTNIFCFFDEWWNVEYNWMILNVCIRYSQWISFQSMHAFFLLCIWNRDCSGVQHSVRQFIIAIGTNWPNSWLKCPIVDWTWTPCNWLNSIFHGSTLIEQDYVMMVDKSIGAHNFPCGSWHAIPI